jgi:pimeloyl-ACP methyl ester carboxylesterase
MEKKSITTKRGTVYYWINKAKGDKCIVFTHGVTADHTLFDRQIAYWSREYTVIVWDMPLHGESRPYQGFTFSNVADDLRMIIMQEGIHHAVMAGQSAGGYAAQAFILKYPDMVDAFIGIDTTPFGSKYYKKSELFWTEHFSDIAKWYPYNYYCKVSAKSVSTTEEAYKIFYDCLVRLGKKGMLESAEAVYKDFPKYEEVKFKCPVLLTIGQYDNTGYVKKYNEMWAKETGYPLVIIPNARHNANLDNYEAFNQITYDFLKALS